MKYKIGIIGAGAIGCFVGGHLINSPADVFFLGRERLGNQVKDSGLLISELNDESFQISADKINWVTDLEQLPLLDLMIITTKSQDTLKTAKELKHKLKIDGLVLSLQNGLHNAEALSQVFPKSQIVIGMVPYNVVQVGERAHFKQSTAGSLSINRKIEILKAIPFTVVKDIEAIQWGKLIKNLNNALNALSNTPLATQLQNQKERRLLSLVMVEAFSVLEKNKINFKNTSVVSVRIFPYVLKLPNTLFKLFSASELKIDPKARLSMWQDLELKRKTEIDYLNGEIVRLAKNVGMSAPVNEKIVCLIKKAESGELDSARSEYQKLLS